MEDAPSLDGRGHFITDAECGAGRIEPFDQHEPPGFLQPEIFLLL
jgi:hypothetical protein